MTKLACVLIAAATALAGAGCDMDKFTVNTTAKVLAKAQPSLQQESDYEMARQAIPGALKTIEGFWVVSPDNDKLIAILTEGYCQYGTAFVEDDWEVAKFAKKLDEIAYHNARASNMFTRCLNYALRSLGPRWQKDIFGTPDVQTKLIKETGADDRTPLMWAALAMGSLINHNLTRVEMLSYLPTVKLMVQRVIELDKANPPAKKDLAALPHIALAMLASGASAQFGGDAKLASDEFEAALKITDDKMLLARALWGYRVGIMTNDRKLFHDQLVKVLETPGSVWPEQRLANEVAHRRARRYLSHEKDLFQ
jgi:hypothetical protein